MKIKSMTVLTIILILAVVYVLYLSNWTVYFLSIVDVCILINIPYYVMLSNVFD